MAVYRPDPGEQFASDVHRRVLAATPYEDPAELWDVFLLVQDDVNIPFTEPDQETQEALRDVLNDLVAEGYLTQEAGRYLKSEAGLDKLAAGLVNEPPALSAEEVAERQAENERLLLAADARAAQSRIDATEKLIAESQANLAEDRATVAEAEDAGVL